MSEQPDPRSMTQDLRDLGSRYGTIANIPMNERVAFAVRHVDVLMKAAIRTMYSRDPRWVSISGIRERMAPYLPARLESAYSSIFGISYSLAHSRCVDIRLARKRRVHGDEAARWNMVLDELEMLDELEKEESRWKQRSARD